MRRAVVLAVAIIAITVVACGGGETTAPPIKKTAAPDPWVTIRVRNLLDTTQAPGRSGWKLYALLTGPQENQNGLSPQGAISLGDVRLGHGTRCIAIGADSIGQRFLSVLALADTVHQGVQPDATYDSIAHRWYAGDHTSPPSGIMALIFGPSDVWTSEQFTAGHGRTMADPIRWSWDWTATASTSLTERASSDTTACNRAGG